MTENAVKKPPPKKLGKAPSSNQHPAAVVAMKDRDESAGGGSKTTQNLALAAPVPEPVREPGAVSVELADGSSRRSDGGLIGDQQTQRVEATGPSTPAMEGSAASPERVGREVTGAGSEPEREATSEGGASDVVEVVPERSATVVEINRSRTRPGAQPVTPVTAPVSKNSDADSDQATNQGRIEGLAAATGPRRAASAQPDGGPKKQGSTPDDDGLVFPDAPPGDVRRVEVSKRGKRDFNYTWACEDVAEMRRAYQHYLPLYSRKWRERDPGGSYRLVFSAFVAKALLVAFDDFDAWSDTIRNDARKEPVAGGREQVGLVWPVEVENRVVEAWETLDRSVFPDGFALTKQHLASAAILYGLRTANQWVLSVTNDDRFNVPVEEDGRLRRNKAKRPSAGIES